VHTTAVVAALLEADFSIAGSLARGLKRTTRRVKIKSLSPDGRSITALEGGETWEELDFAKRGLVLLGERGTSEEEVFAESSKDGTWLLLRPARAGDELAVLELDAEEIRLKASEAVQAAMRRRRVAKAEGCLVWCCTGLYRNRDAFGLDLVGDIRQTAKTVGTDVVGCFLDGEAGIENTGLPALTNWGAVRILMGDELRDRSIYRLGYGALAKQFGKLAATKNLEETIDVALDVIADAGFQGGMISLIIGLDNAPQVVALGSRGVRFERIRNDTRRRLDGDDVIARVAVSQQARFVAETSRDPQSEPNSARKSGLVSQCILPLQDQRGTVLGVLQVDLGDLRTLEQPRPAMVAVLEAIASGIAESIARVAASEEARVIAALHTAFHEALECDSVERAMQRYIEAAVRAFGASGGHVREWRREEEYLQLLVGTGDYSEAAAEYRRTIDTSDPSRTGEAFVEKIPVVINDAQADQHTKDLLARPDVPENLKTQIRKLGSSADVYYNNGAQSGTITLQSESTYFFHTHRERCLHELAERAGLLLAFLDSSRKHTTAERELKALLDLAAALKQLDEAPKLDAGLTALASGIRQIFGADVASVFLWNGDVKQFALRGQEGWSDPGWIGAARYKEHEGWTGSVAVQDRPAVFPNLNEYKRDTARGPFGTYEEQCWGNRARAGITVRGLAIPLKYKGRQLGVVTLLIAQDGKREKTFALESEATLVKIAAHIAAHVGVAVIRAESDLNAKWRAASDKVVREFTGALHGGDPARVLCKTIAEEFRASEVAFYFVEQGATGDPRCVAAYPKSARPQADEGVRSALRAGKTQTELDAGGSGDEGPKPPARQGVIRKVWILTPGPDGAAGVIMVSWPENTQVHESDVNHQVIEELTSLGRVVGTVYERHLADCEQKSRHAADKKSDAAITAMSAMLSNSVHQFAGLLNRLTRAQQEVLDGQTQNALKIISKILDDGTTLIHGPLDVATSIAQLDQRSLKLKPLVDDAMAGLAEEDRKLVEVAVDPGIRVWAEPRVTVLAFRNVIHNAIEAIRRKPGGGVLIVTSTQCKRTGRVCLEFQDTGIGMTQKQVDAAWRGFVRSDNGIGVGVLLSRASIEVQGGSMTIKSTLGVGTSVHVELTAEAEVAR
jgi:signal transduction histidine kinase